MGLRDKPVWQRVYKQTLCFILGHKQPDRHYNMLRGIYSDYICMRCVRWVRAAKTVK